MTCLHLCNGYFGNRVHKNLYNEIDKIGLKQIVFASFHKKYIGSEKSIDSNYQIIISDLLSIKNKLFFRYKINKHLKKIKTECDLKSISIIHATTLFSDGAIAYKLSKSFNIPYIVNVRETDIGIFLKMRPDLFNIGYKILINANKIVFISEASKNRFYSNLFINLFANKLINKTLIIPNAIDTYWLNDLFNKKVLYPSKIIYIGRFQKRKNVIHLIKAVLKLKENLSEIQLTIIGKSGEDEKKVIKLAKKYQGTINYLGYIDEKEKLKELLRENHIFAMPSYGETFGLVYIEALSQGLPILYSKGTGVDGLFNDIIVGEAVNPKSLKSIEKGISNIIHNYNNYSINKINFNDYNWSSKAQTYAKIYNSIVLK